MSDELVIGLAGIASTLIASGIGFYFLSKERSSGLRASLFEEQLRVIKRIAHCLGRVRVYLNILAEPKSQFAERARDDFVKCIPTLSELEGEGAAIFPVELWSEIDQVVKLLSKCAESYDKDSVLSPEQLRGVVARQMKILLLCRGLVGADELSEESINLFASKKGYKGLSQMDVAIFESIYDDHNT